MMPPPTARPLAAGRLLRHRVRLGPGEQLPPPELRAVDGLDVRQAGGYILTRTAHSGAPIVREVRVMMTL